MNCGEGDCTFLDTLDRVQMLTLDFFCHVSRKQHCQGCNDNEVPYLGGSADYEVHNLAWQAARMDWKGKTPKYIFL